VRTSRRADWSVVGRRGFPLLTVGCVQHHIQEVGKTGVRPLSPPRNGTATTASSARNFRLLWVTYTLLSALLALATATATAGKKASRFCRRIRAWQA
jgi:hypothetical protein